MSIQQRSTWMFSVNIPRLGIGSFDPGVSSENSICRVGLRSPLFYCLWHFFFGGYRDRSYHGFCAATGSASPVERWD